MKRAVKVALILILMFSTITTLAFINIQSNKIQSSSVNEVSSSETDVYPQTASCFSLTLNTSEVFQCSELADAELEVAELASAYWESSAPDVAFVSDEGAIQAVAEGNAEITAYASGSKVCSIDVTVYDSIENYISNLVTSFAANGGDDDFDELSRLEQQLDSSANQSAKKYSDAIAALMDYSRSGSGEAAADSEDTSLLAAAMSDAGISISAETLQSAALSAYCQGEKSSSDVIISFTGDCTFAYYNESSSGVRFPAVYANSGSVTYPLDKVKNVFGADDITMINFEGTLTSSTAHADKTFYFRGEPSYVNILTASSVEAVTLANNHSFDYLQIGYDDTIDALTQAEIAYCDFSSPAVISVNGYSVVMLSLSLVNSSYTEKYKSQLEEYISEYKSDGAIVIVNLHWGIEGDDTPASSQIEIAHSIIDAGADLIIGHHPHRLQGIEEYNGSYIVYSLGNFSFGGNSSASWPETVILRAAFSDDGSGLELDGISVVPCYTTSSGGKSNNYQPIALFGDEGQSVVDYLISLSESIDGGISSVKWSQIS